MSATTGTTITTRVLADLHPGHIVGAPHSRYRWKLATRTELLSGGWRCTLVGGNGSKLVTDAEMVADGWRLHDRATPATGAPLTPGQVVDLLAGAYADQFPYATDFEAGAVAYEHRKTVEALARLGVTFNAPPGLDPSRAGASG